MNNARTTALPLVQILVAGLVFGSLTAVRGFGDDLTPPRETEYVSLSKEYVAVVTPGADLKQPGHCRLRLFRSTSTGRQLLWERCLINNVAPRRVLVSDSGKFVVTMDEWWEPGSLPLVIYGPPNGTLCAQVHTRRSLGLLRPENLARGTSFALDWRRYSMTFFDPKDETLFIRLRSGQMLMIDLSTGDVMDEEWCHLHEGSPSKMARWQQCRDFGERRAREIALELLSGPAVSDRVTGAIAVGQLNVRAAVPALRTLLADEETILTKNGKHDGPIVVQYIVRKAAKEALEALGESVEGVTIERVP